MKSVIITWEPLAYRKFQGLVKGRWYVEGPTLPIEYSHIAPDGRLRAVIDPVAGTAIPTRFAISIHSSRRGAIEDMREHECTNIENVGFTDFAEIRSSVEAYPNHAAGHRRVVEFLERYKIDAGVWNATSPNFLEKKNCDFTVEAAVEHLKTLLPKQRKSMLAYIRRHKRINTGLRRHLFGGDVS